MEIDFRALLKRQVQDVRLSKCGKGSHSYWVHPRLLKPVVISGKDGKDAKPYQEKDVVEALEELNQL